MVLEKTPESPLDSKEIKPVNSKRNQPWTFIGRTDAEAEASILWPPDVKRQLTRKRLWCWEGLKTGGEEDDRGQDGWMASLTQWTWVWASSGRWWRTGKPGVLQSMGLQRVGHNWATEQQPPWTWPLSGMARIPHLSVTQGLMPCTAGKCWRLKFFNCNPCRLWCLVGVTEENDILWGTPGSSGKCQLRNVSPLRAAFNTGIPDLWLPRTFSLDLSFLVLFQLWPHSDPISECAHLDAQLSSFILWPLGSHICIWPSALKADWLFPLQTHLSLQDHLPHITFRGHHPQTPALTQ